MRVYQEESFGPLASVVMVDGPQEALRVADDNDYGLSSAIFSRNVTVALDLAKRLNAGMSHINGTTLDDEAQIPFGGGQRQRLWPVGRRDRDRRAYRASVDHDRRPVGTSLSDL
jgi:acyl-CoA reductase-like NAD-dependent aldehyde dehydrogenase